MFLSSTEIVVNSSVKRRIPEFAGLIELEEIMIKKFGNRNMKTNKWHGIKIKEEEIDDILEELDN